MKITLHFADLAVGDTVAFYDLAGPHAFASDHSRFVYYRTPGRDPDYAAHDDTTCEVIVMSGLPGAGKSHHVAHQLAHLPQVSLDAVREELALFHAEEQAAERVRTDMNYQLTERMRSMQTWRTKAAKAWALPWLKLHHHHHQLQPNGWLMHKVLHVHHLLHRHCL